MRIPRTGWLPVRREEMAMPSFQREINRLFDDFFTGFGSRVPSDNGQALSTFSPKIDLVNNEKSLVVRAEVPGLTEKDFDISITDETLVLRGEKKHEEKREEGGTHYFESTYGQFERVIPLNFEVDKDKIDAKLRKGVLEIVLPKSSKAQEKTRQISVKAE